MQAKDLLQLADQFGSPLYVYDAEKIQSQYNRLTKAFSKVENLRVNYAMKALSNVAILQLLKNMGSGLDTVSIQEVLLGLHAGYDPDKIFFTPNGVSLEEIDLKQKTESLQSIEQELKISQIAFLKQEHGVQGQQIEVDDDQSYIFNPVGDYLFTQRKSCGIGVVTADCLPIVIYDPVTYTAGIVHAGWKGLQAGVFQVALKNMQKKLGVKLENLEVYLGPAARSCCYEVQQDFIEQFQKHQDSFDEIFIKKDDKTYFDSRAFITVIARSLGIDAQKIYTRYNVCTICNKSFCSYRRDKEKARRQITMICLS